MDALRTYGHPVFVYIPPGGELRGGAWVVVDALINESGRAEMYADPGAVSLSVSLVVSGRFFMGFGRPCGYCRFLAVLFLAIGFV